MELETHGVSGVAFHDLRGTAVTRLALAGCTEAEIASITGPSLKMPARSSMRTISIAIPSSQERRSPSSKQERRFPTELPTGQGCFWETVYTQLKTWWVQQDSNLRPAD